MKNQAGDMIDVAAENGFVIFTAKGEQGSITISLSPNNARMLSSKLQNAAIEAIEQQDNNVTVTEQVKPPRLIKRREPTMYEMMSGSGP